MEQQRVLPRADSDAAVVTQVQGGNGRRFSVLVERHSARAMTLALRILGNRQDAEEAVQDAFVRAYRGLAGFKGDARFGTWFYRILYNQCMTRLQRSRHRPEQLEIDDPAAGAIDMVPDPSLDRALEREESRALVADEMERLPQAFKAVLTLFYVQELSYEEIADVTGTAMGTVKTNLHRGRNLLRQRVRERLNGEVKVA